MLLIFYNYNTNRNEDLSTAYRFGPLISIRVVAPHHRALYGDALI